jgi:outer membrane immunogenic protein
MKERPMRWVFCLAMMLGTAAAPALAADLDVLRGSEPIAPVVTVGPATFTRWSGFYVGGVASYSTASADFAAATRPLIAFSLRATTLEEQVAPSTIAVLGKGSATAFGGGAFLGYNTQWQDLILGVEATYTRTNLNTTAPASAVARTFPTVDNAVALSANGHLGLTDYGEARLRAGYIVGSLLPYGFMGVAVGRASYNVSTVTEVAQPNSAAANPDLNCLGGATTPTCSSFSFANSAGQDNALLWGFSVGAGLDWALTQNFFLRGEFEFVQFTPIANINLALFSGRVGGGFKF